MILEGQGTSHFWWKADPVERRAFVWSAIGLGMLIVVTLIGEWSLRQINETDRWVEHTRDVIAANERLLADVKDAESAERGYIITGDAGYLVPYQAATQDVAGAYSKLQQLTDDNAAQQARLQRLNDLIQQRLAVLESGLRERKQSGFDAARNVVLSGRGRAVMEQIREVSAQIEAEESRLLEERSHTRQVRIRNGSFAAFAATLLALVAFLVAPLDVRRVVRERDLAARAQKESESTAHALFQEAAQGIFLVDKTGHIVMANPAAAHILGYAENELVGQAIEVLVPDNVRQAHPTHRDSYFVNPQNRPMGFGRDLRARRKDGTEFPAEISLSSVNTANGPLAVAFLTDISKRKADEDAIRRQREDLRNLSGQLMSAQDDERRRIARDLHDDLSQKLAYLAIDLGRIGMKPEAALLVDDLRPLQTRATEASNTVRHISHQLHPSVLDDIGLDAALEQFCSEFEQRTGIATEYFCRDVPEPLPPEIARSLYHIAQESLRNVSKHSRTESVRVTLEHSDGVLRLTVKDEGVGLPPERAGKGIGMVAMKERAHLVNGKVSIASEQGQGTEVRVDVPV
jgi:PAS domain S-box-containing protein